MCMHSAPGYECVYEFVMRLTSFTRGSSSRSVKRANGGRERAKESIKRIYGRKEARDGKGKERGGKKGGGIGFKDFADG